MLGISEQVVLAFEARAGNTELAEFSRWWQARHERLGVIMPDRIKPTLEQARTEARGFGITDNENNRIFLTAAALKLLPSPTPRTLLLAIDVIFLDADDDERLDQLAVLRGALA